MREVMSGSDTNAIAFRILNVYIPHETAVCLNHRHTVLQETEKTLQTLNRPTIKHLIYS